MTQNSRKQFNIEEKALVISRLEGGTPNNALAREFGVSHSTISTIWRERVNIKKLYQNNLFNRKRARTTKHTKIEEALLKWFKYRRANKLRVSGPLLREKANEFAKNFGIDFAFTSSWIQRFRRRHCIVGRKLIGKAPSSMDDEYVPTDEEQSTDNENSIDIIFEPDTEIEVKQEVPDNDEENDEGIGEQHTMPSLINGLNAVSVLRKLIHFKEQFHIQGEYEEMLRQFQCELQNSYVQQNNH